MSVVVHSHLSNDSNSQHTTEKSNNINSKCHEIALMLICTIKPRRSKSNAMHAPAHTLVSCFILLQIPCNFHFEFCNSIFRVFFSHFFLFCFWIVLFLLLLLWLLSFFLQLKKKEKRCQQKFHQFQSWVTSLRLLCEGKLFFFKDFYA